MKYSAVYESKYVVNADDVDLNNNMKLTSFLKVMQNIGAKQSKEYGYGISDEKITHKAWIVLAWKINVIKKPKCDDSINVKTWIGRMDKIYYYRDFEMTDKSGEVLARCVSKWVILDTVSCKVEKITEEYLNKFNIAQNDKYINNIPKVNSKICLDNLKSMYTYTVMKRDIDTNKHMNNVVYLDIAMETMEDNCINNCTNIEIHYLSECKYLDKLSIMKKNNEIYFFNDTKDKVSVIIKLS